MDDKETIGAIFGVERALIGVVHVQALPGSPSQVRPVAEIAEIALAEARLYEAAGFHGLILENMHDRPYLKRSVGPETIAAMTVVAQTVAGGVELPFGIQILAGANRESIAVAHACGGSFVRAEGFVFAHVADEGTMESDAGELLRYRRSIGATAVRVFADIKKKHSSHAMTADVDLVETAHAAEFFQADGVVVTGAATGKPTDANEVEAVSLATGIPTLVGSGVTPENIPSLGAADALIVGSSAKRDGLWSNEIEPERLAALARAFATSTTAK